MPSHEQGASPLLRAQALACRRGDRSVFAGLSFELAAGHALELRGANGSGKTSLLRLLAGLAPAAAGTLHAGCGIAYLGHLNGLSAELSAAENLRFAQQLNGDGDEAGALQASPQSALESWGVGALAARPVRRLSQGQQRRVALARMALGGRRLWLLDEPCAGLDEAGERLFDTRLAAHLAGGGLAVIATHQPLRLPAARCRPLLLGAAATC